MKTFFSDPVWLSFKRKIEERYGHLSDADLALIECDENGWTERLERVLHRSPMEIANLVDEVMAHPPLQRQSPPQQPPRASA